MNAKQSYDRSMAPVEIHSHAMESLRFIRDTMERASAFTAVPGWGMVGIGASALLAATVASLQRSTEAGLAIWLVEAAVALAIGVAAAIRKARRLETELWSAPAQKFALAFAPPLVLGAILTLALWTARVPALIPGVWLGLYGIGVIGAGAYSARVVPAMGAAFALAGILTLFLPSQLGNACLAVGFGGLHLVFGWIIARRHGG